MGVLDGRVPSAVPGWHGDVDGEPPVLVPHCRVSGRLASPVRRPDLRRHQHERRGTPGQGAPLCVGLAASPVPLGLFRVDERDIPPVRRAEPGHAGVHRTRRGHSRPSRHGAGPPARRHRASDARWHGGLLARAKLRDGEVQRDQPVPRPPGAYAHRAGRDAPRIRGSSHPGACCGARLLHGAGRGAPDGGMGAGADVRKPTAQRGDALGAGACIGDGAGVFHPRRRHGLVGHGCIRPPSHHSPVLRNGRSVAAVELERDVLALPPLRAPPGPRRSPGPSAGARASSGLPGTRDWGRGDVLLPHAGRHPGLGLGLQCRPPRLPAARVAGHAQRKRARVYHSTGAQPGLGGDCAEDPCPVCLCRSSKGGSPPHSQPAGGNSAQRADAGSGGGSSIGIGVTATSPAGPEQRRLCRWRVDWQRIPASHRPVAGRAHRHLPPPLWRLPSLPVPGPHACVLPSRPDGRGGGPPGRPGLGAGPAGRWVCGAVDEQPRHGLEHAWAARWAGAGRAGGARSVGVPHRPPRHQRHLRRVRLSRAVQSRGRPMDVG
mmetsp:Transcript_16554/g.52784  ORF Transcript_16554/g.52784 Transcript_16554/m.52784 type:complete len:546 (+) Transcript_16554:349-1986(+)